ncbi:MAG: spo0F3 [bacterium]|nr:spo0F3 [bacterium]
MGELILIVDDEHAIVETLAEVLRWEGYEALCAPNGQVALEMMAARRPSLVLLDFMMPVLDGRQTLAAMRCDVSLAMVPVIMMSAAAAVPAVAGADWQHYLRKPFRAPALMTVVRALLAPG